MVTYRTVFIAEDVVLRVPSLLVSLTDLKIESFYVIKYKPLKVVELGQYCLNLFEQYI